MNYTLIYEFISLTIFAISLGLALTISFVRKKVSSLRCFLYLFIPKLIQQYVQYYNTNIEQTIWTTVLVGASTIILDFLLFFVVFDSPFQEIIVAIVSCELSSIPLVFYKTWVSELLTVEGSKRIYVDNFNVFISAIAGYIVAATIVVLVVFLLGKLLRKINYETKLFSILGKIGMCGFIAMELFTIIDDGILFLKSKEYLFRYAWGNFAWILLFVAMYIINDYFTKKKLRREIEVLNEEKARQFEYYNLVKIHNEEIRKIRHDMKGHISAISTLVEEKEYDRAKEYVSTLNENFSKIKRVNITGNVTADTVICDMAEKCLSQNIKFTPKGFLPEKTGIDDVSLTCIFKNILNNAYEACLRMDENENKFINLDVRIAGDCIVIKCVNSKITNEKINTKSIRTIKKESGHGYGMKIINEIVKEKDGTIQIEDKAEAFEIKILLTGANCLVD